MPADRDSERGAALLTVLLLVSIVGAIAAVTLEKLNLSTRLASNTAAMNQARAYAQAAETMAKVRIDGLLSGDSTRITLQGGWSDKPFPLPVPVGSAAVRVRDGGNCFNLNSLVTAGDQGVWIVRPSGMQQFVRLMHQLNLPDAEGIAAAAADWIDTDETPFSGGAEDAAYAGRAPGYRVGDTFMADPSELRAVAGVTPEIYAKLRPWVCALPTSDPAKINVNTLLPEQGALIAMLLPDTLSANQIRQVLMARPTAGWASTNDFWAQPGMKSANPGDAGEQVAVTTRWFALTTDVAIGRVSLRETGLIDAGETPARLVSRQWGDAG